MTKQNRNFNSQKKERKQNVDMIIHAALEGKDEEIANKRELLAKNDVYEQFAIPVFAYRADMIEGSDAAKKSTIIVGHINKYVFEEEKDNFDVNVFGINAAAVEALIKEQDAVVLPVFRKHDDVLCVVKFVITTPKRIAADKEARQTKFKKQ